MCVRGIDFACYYDFPREFCNCTDSVVCFSSASLTGLFMHSLCSMFSEFYILREITMFIFTMDNN